jgi:hypothetical protein
MRLTTIVFTGLLTSVAGASLACDLPSLAVIPPKEQVAGNAEAIRVAAAAYFEAMQAYTACLKAELDAAGGDAAPALVKSTLIRRNNDAVREAEFMIKLYQTNLGVAAPQGPPAGAPRPAN